MKLTLETFVELYDEANSILANEKKNKEARAALERKLMMLLSPVHDRKDAELVLICGKPMWIDKDNLRDKTLCKRSDSGEYQSVNGEQHFTWDNAKKAAEKQGKRLMTDEEHEFIESLPRRWFENEEISGYYITFDNVYGGIVEIFFPAAGCRNYTAGTIYYAGSNGCYWSSLVSSTASAYYLGFYSSTVFTRPSNSRSYGFSVRCVAPIN